MVRDTQNYIHLAARGLTLFDVLPARVDKDLAQWQGVCTWLDQKSVGPQTDWCRCADMATPVGPLQ